jgi:hypothetical protein
VTAASEAAYIRIVEAGEYEQQHFSRQWGEVITRLVVEGKAVLNLMHSGGVENWSLGKYRTKQLLQFLVLLQ